MDFDQLLRRAQSNQSSVQKKHEHQRLEKRKEEDKVKIKQETAKKKATEQLKAMAEKRHKEKLKYKGITTLPASRHESSKSSVLQDRVSPKPKRPEDSRQDKTKRPSTKDKISGQKSSQAKNQQDTKKPAKTTVASSVSSKVAGSAKNGERKSASGKATIDAPSQAVKSTKFQDLIQLAAQNSNPSKNPASKGGVSFPGKDKSASVLSSAALIRRKTAMERGGRSRSPAGLAVVRSECASRTPSPGLKSSGVKSPSGLKVSANSKTDSLKHKTKTGSAASGKSPNKDTKSNSANGRELAKPGAASSTGSGGAALARRPLRNGPPPVKSAGQSPATGRSPAKPTRPPSAGTARVIPGGPRGGSARGMPGGPRGGSARGMPGGPRGGSARGMAGGPRGKAGASTNARSFYGAAAANILRGQKSRPGFGGRYTSTWVDEMSDYLDTNQLDMAEEEEDSDLDGFVTSDEEFLDDGDAENDYSSEIRKIFGYDRTRYNDRDVDEGAMESSFAQQEFEEKRSAMIGMKEDEEDLARERAALKRKRTSHKSTSKQTKLSF